MSSQPRHTGLIIAIALFIASRIAAYLAGVRFSAEPLDFFWQFLDPQILRSELLEGLYYLHSQPPGYNLFLGVVLKLFPAHESLVFHLIHIGFGLVLAISLYRLLIRLGAGVPVAVLGVVIVACAPSAILYENILFYTYPLAMIITLGFLLLHRFLISGQLRDLIALLLCLVLMVLTRSLFHIVWLAAAVGALALIRPLSRRRILLVGGVAILIGAMPYIKNACEFGSFSSSTWGGMSLARMTTLRLDRSQRERLVAEQALDSLIVLAPYLSLPTYRERAGVATAQPTGITALDQEFKSTGAPNFNHLTYIDISRRYKSAALDVIRNRPEVYLAAFLEATKFCFLPTSSFMFLGHDRGHIDTWDKIYNHVLRGQPVYRRQLTEPPETANIAFLSIIGYGTVFAWSLTILWRSRRRLGRINADDGTIAFVGLTTVYVLLVGNAFEIGENMRFRFMVEPVYWTVAITGVTRLVRHFGAGQSPWSVSPDSDRAQ